MKKLIITVLLLCTACSNSIHNQYKGTYRIGSTYTINGETYYPQYYDKYEEIGIASWYSEECNKCLTHDECKSCITANGELFDKDRLTAAHRTLPMPSMVKVANLDNGKIIILKVNDRGPFKHNRILDVTEKVAKELGFKDLGLAMVKVEYLKRATEKLVHSKPHYKEPYRRIVDEMNRKRNIFFHNSINSKLESFVPTKKKETVKKTLPKKKKDIHPKIDNKTKCKKSIRHRKFT